MSCLIECQLESVIGLNVQRNVRDHNFLGFTVACYLLPLTFNKQTNLPLSLFEARESDENFSSLWIATYYVTIANNWLVVDRLHSELAVFHLVKLQLLDEPTQSVQWIMHFPRELSLES